MRPHSREPTTLEEQDDAELLERVAKQAEDASGARAAQAIFYRRHVRYLYGALLRHGRLLSSAGLTAEDLAQETFHRAFERAHTFAREEGLDESRLERRVRAWLGRIATHLLADRLRQSREVSATPYLERVTCDALDEESAPSPKRELVSRGLEQLTERERDVLAVSALYYRAGEHQRLPNAASAELASRWGITNDNVRAIRTRAMKKLRAFLSEEGLATEGAT